MEGAQYSPLIKDTWIYGIDRKRMYNTIMYGITGTDMIAWSTVLSKDEINALTDHILAKQGSEPSSEFDIPDSIETKDYSIKVETLVAEGFRSSLGVSSLWMITELSNRAARRASLDGRWKIGPAAHRRHSGHYSVRRFGHAGHGAGSRL